MKEVIILTLMLLDPTDGGVFSKNIIAGTKLKGPELSMTLCKQRGNNEVEAYYRKTGKDLLSFKCSFAELKMGPEL